MFVGQGELSSTMNPKIIEFVYSFSYLQIPISDIKLEDPPLNIESGTEDDVSIEYPNVINSKNSEPENCVIFTRTLPELPSNNLGKPNSSIRIVANSKQELSTILCIGTDGLKQLGKAVYKKFFHRLREKNHLEVTLSEIQEDLIRIQKMAEKDTFSEVQEDLLNFQKLAEKDPLSEVCKVKLSISSRLTAYEFNPT